MCKICTVQVFNNFCSTDLRICISENITPQYGITSAKAHIETNKFMKSGTKLMGETNVAFIPTTFRTGASPKDYLLLKQNKENLFSII